MHTGRNMGRRMLKFGRYVGVRRRAIRGYLENEKETWYKAIALFLKIILGRKSQKYT